MDSAAREIILSIVLVVGWSAVLVFLVGWFYRGKISSWFKSRRLKLRPVADNESVLLAIEVPKEDEKTPLAAETLFSSLHGIGNQHLSFEIEATEKSIRFYVWVPKNLKSYVEGQFYAQYPDINVLEAKDYSIPHEIKEDISVVSTELAFNKKDFYPIKTFLNFTVDPLAAITGTISKLAPDERIWIQILVKPEADKWRDRAINFISAIKEGRSTELGSALTKQLVGLAGDVVRTAVQGGSEDTVKEGVKLSPGTEQVLAAIEEKSSGLGFRTKIRLVVLDKNETTARQRLQLTIGAFKQFNTNNLNSFVAGPHTNKRDEILSQYHNRKFGPGGLILNVTELASVYHLPNKTVVTPNIVWAGSKKGEPPANLPLLNDIPAEELTVLATTNFRGSNRKFGIKLKDRHRHIYIIGKSGTGKSTLLVNMTIDDIRERRGVAVIDPHGDYVDAVLDYVPNYRVNDTIVFDPGDRQHPIAINMLEVKDPKYKVVVTSGVVGIFKKIFGYSWGPRLEYWLSSAVLALLDYPDATLMMIPRIFTEKGFRDKVIDKIKDPLIKNRWINEYNRLDQRQQNETIAPILNKVGQFLSSPVIRNIVGQPKSTIDFRKVMDKGQVLLVKLAKGMIGEDNAALLGAMIITQIQLASMTRADIPEDERKDFYLYVDEFQNFATESFQAILSESRKYHLSLTLANQYMDQLIPEVRDAIFGNVNTIITFRVGGSDAESLEKEFAPVFNSNDLVNLSMFNIYIKLSIDNLTTSAFSAQTLPLSIDKNDIKDKVIKASREHYAKDVMVVEEKITKTIEEAIIPPTRSTKPQKFQSYYNKNRGDRPSYNRPKSNLPDRPVPYRPGMKFDDHRPKSEGVSSTANQTSDKPDQKPKESLLKKVISAIESKKPWVPPTGKKKQNLVSDLGKDESDVDRLRRQRSSESGAKKNEWTSADLQDEESNKEK